MGYAVRVGCPVPVHAGGRGLGAAGAERAHAPRDGGVAPVEQLVGVGPDSHVQRAAHPVGAHQRVSRLDPSREDTLRATRVA